MSDVNALPAAAQVHEDHHLSDAEHAGAWAELVDWVTWLHDAYELSFDERLPPCWPKHPGLVRELAALRAWRAEIYTPRRPPGENGQRPVTGNGGPARAWHTELRNVLTAARTDYARGCRAGHRAAPTRLIGDEERRTAWIDQRPARLLPHGTSPDTTAESEPGRGHRIGGSEMRGHLDAGRARRISPDMPAYAHHHGSWWVAGPDDTWLEITDPAVATRLDDARTHWARTDPPHETPEDHPTFERSEPPCPT